MDITEKKAYYLHAELQNFIIIETSWIGKSLIKNFSLTAEEVVLNFKPLILGSFLYFLNELMFKKFDDGEKILDKFLFSIGKTPIEMKKILKFFEQSDSIEENFCNIFENHLGVPKSNPLSKLYFTSIYSTCEHMVETVKLVGTKVDLINGEFDFSENKPIDS